MGMGGRGVVGDRWSQRILWICALGSAASTLWRWRGRRRTARGR
ncbi:HrpN-interacting protein from malus protein [Zea mays]|uniref:HrpN-interacting protein from malus protein n=1 Tax=Zea mays TaxID=4577 RepID=K7UEV2_MAIZE|nr:HrpN-interacting protein from malus protein [Zea mays]